MKLKNEPSLRTIQRARKNPESAMARTLATLAAEQKTTIEQLLKVPLYLLNVRIDAFILVNGYAYGYKMQYEHYSNAKYACMKNDEYFIASRPPQNCIILGQVTAQVKIFKEESNCEGNMVRVV